MSVAVQLYATSGQQPGEGNGAALVGAILHPDVSSQRGEVISTLHRAGTDFSKPDISSISPADLE